MRFVPCMVIMGLGLALAGCTTFGKKPAASPNPPPRAAADDRPLLPDRNPPPAAGATAVSPVEVSGILAGLVIDRTYQQPPATIIQVSEASASANGPPVEVETNPQGYFTIKGLQPGRHYQLTARSMDGQHRAVGFVYATPPDARVVIHISDDPSTPNIPLPPGASPQGFRNPMAAPDAPNSGERPSIAAERGWAPGRGSNGPGNPTPEQGPAALGPPVGMNGAPAPQTPWSSPPPNAPAPAPPAAAWHPENTVQGAEQVRVDPLTFIAPQVRRGPPEATPPAPPGPPGPPATPARVPSCDLTGKTLYNFALNDLNGQPWEFRQHPARLTLIDFWGTWCVHCVHAIPHLNILQQRYGPYGLQVVGIAYEEGPLLQQIQQVNRMRQIKAMNYQILLGSDRGSCPVCTQFQVRSWPTLFLVDDQGRLIYRTEGLDADHLRELEIIIGQRLAAR